MSVELTAQSAEDLLHPPQNGVAGFKHLRHDILSGIVVSLVSLPLSSGIAIASGVPPIYGLISAIIAGFIFPFIGGAYMTIAGPAAGLAPALVAIQVSLGGVGDADHVGAGYPFLLCVIFAVGVVQVILAALKLAKVAGIIPFCVVEGMLASIGLMIIVKQLPYLFGYLEKIHAHEFYQFILEAPTFIMGANPLVVLVSTVTLVALFVLGSMKNVSLLKIIPPQLIAVIIGVILAQIVGLGSINPKFLISLPKEVFHGFHLPDFTSLLTRQDLWSAALIAVVTLTLIDGVESLATAMAIDRIDPFRRKSQPNRVLLAMGISNVASSLVGGLTIIPGGVKSKANIASGGRTLWANFTNAVCLLVYLLVAASLINAIPKGVLAAVLIYTGWKMCEPLVWRHIAKIGLEQLAVFSITVVTTLATDLLVGIIVGTLAELFINVLLYRGAVKAKPIVNDPTLLGIIHQFFSNPVMTKEMKGDAYHLYLDRPLVCFNSMKLASELDVMPPEAKSVVVHLNEHVRLIDHTSCECLMGTIQDYSNRHFPIEVIGLDSMNARSHYPAAARSGLALEDKETDPDKPSVVKD